MHDNNERQDRRGADGEPLRERGTVPNDAENGQPEEPPVDETDDGPSPSIHGGDAGQS